MANDYIVVMDKTGVHLEHRDHKYTKREWQGKGWRYWYGDQYKKDAEQARFQYENAKRASRRFADDAGLVTKDYLNKQKALGTERFREKYQRGTSDTLNKEAAEYARTAYNSQKLYEKSLAGKIEAGGKLVQSLLSKWKKKVNETAINTAKKLGLKTQQVETRTDISTGQKWRRVNGGAWEKVR